MHASGELILWLSVATQRGDSESSFNSEQRFADLVATWTGGGMSLVASAVLFPNYRLFNQHSVGISLVVGCTVTHTEVARDVGINSRTI